MRDYMGLMLDQAKAIGVGFVVPQDVINDGTKMVNEIYHNIVLAIVPCLYWPEDTFDVAKITFLEKRTKECGASQASTNGEHNASQISLASRIHGILTSISQASNFQSRGGGEYPTKIYKDEICMQGRCTHVLEIKRRHGSLLFILPLKIYLFLGGFMQENDRLIFHELYLSHF